MNVLWQVIHFNLPNWLLKREHHVDEWRLNCSSNTNSPPRSRSLSGLGWRRMTCFQPCLIIDFLQSLRAASVMRSLISRRRSQSIFSKQLRSWAEQTTSVITQAYAPLSLRIRCYKSLLNEAAALWWGVKYQIVCFIQRAAEKGVAPRGELLYYLSAGRRHTEVKCDMWE